MLNFISGGLVLPWLFPFVFCTAAHADSSDLWKERTGSILAGCDASWKPGEQRESLGQIYKNLETVMGRTPAKPTEIALETARLRFTVLRCAQLVVRKNLAHQSSSAYGRMIIKGELDRLEEIGVSPCVPAKPECRLNKAFRDALIPVRRWAKGFNLIVSPDVAPLENDYNQAMMAERSNARVARQVERIVNEKHTVSSQWVPGKGPYISLSPDSPPDSAALRD